MPDSFDDFCSLWPGADSGGKMRGMQLCILSPAIFKNAFDVYNFFIISNLFDSISLALSTHNGKCASETHHIWRSTQN